MKNHVEALSSAVVKVTKTFILQNGSSRFVKSADAIASVTSDASIKCELGMYRTTIHNAILRVVTAHNGSLESSKKALAKGKTLGGMFPQLEGLY